MTDSSIDSILERHVDRSGECWLWTAATLHGYGYVRFAGRMHRAHRLIYSHLERPIPDAMTLDHLCGNTACVNPQHLEPVTAIENIRRAVERRKLATTCRHGHEFTDANTATGSRGQRVCRECKRRWNADAKRKLRAAS